jgi:hypothetical protein
MLGGSLNFAEVDAIIYLRHVVAYQSYLLNVIILLPSDTSTSLGFYLSDGLQLGVIKA